ncbi:PIN1 [Symbiodinium sp. CCMP2456]|nr:PIN1 [Symbiodinium sp. CCMP2456]
MAPFLDQYWVDGVWHARWDIMMVIKRMDEASRLIPFVTSSRRRKELSQRRLKPVTGVAGAHRHPQQDLGACSQSGKRHDGSRHRWPPAPTRLGPARVSSEPCQRLAVKAPAHVRGSVRARLAGAPVGLDLLKCQRWPRLGNRPLATISILRPSVAGRLSSRNATVVVVATRLKIPHLALDFTMSWVSGAWVDFGKTAALPGMSAKGGPATASMACQFSEGWSGTPMWQLAQGREETMRKEREAREAQAGDVLEIDNEAAGFRSVLYVSRMVGDKYEDSKVRGPRRKTRAQAIKDGLSLRNACRDAPKDAKLEAAQRRSVELMYTFWKPEELPKEDFDFEESVEKPMRLRLARKPRGNGWQRVGDKEFFRHCSAPMAFDPVKGRYLKIDAETNSYIDCDVPHDPIEYSVSVSVGASLVGQTDEDLNAPDRPRSMLLKELVKTGAAMKTPLFFLDQPAACFAMFDGVRGGAAVEWCSKHLHTKLLPQLSASITYWHDADLRGLLRSILSELDVQLVQQAGCCWEGVSIAVALLLGDRLVVASLGGTHALVAAPDGRWRSLDGRHVASSAEEQARSKALGAEIVGEETGKGVVGAPFVQKVVQARDWQVVEDATAEEEVTRVLDRTSDCFATLGLGPEDKIDGKAARSCYKKLALKVHPDKAPEELKARAKAAFEKVEKAAADVEAFCETDVEATECLHRILHAAGPRRASMSRATAFDVLGIPEDCSLEEAGRQGRDLRETIIKLGMLTGGNYGHPDQAEAVRMIEEAAEAIAEPAALTASKGGASFSSLKPIQVTRALGLRDLKLPRKIVSSEPQIDVIQLEALGSHHLVLLSSGATSLSDQEVIERIRGFSGQPKAGSLLVAADAAAKNAAQSITGPQRFGCCIVGVFEVGSGYVEPAAKKAKKDGGDKVRCRHILLKHKDLKQKMDPQAHLRSKGPVTRPLAQAERELMRLKESLTKDTSQFPAMARKHSECKSALQPGQMAGDLGWISKGSLGDQAMEDVVLALEVNELSDLVTTARGVHLVQRYA